MVEMTEVANILNNATRDSLVLLDEIGRGTSTFDGLSIAWAVLEHIADNKIIGSKTLFATHYHELTQLEGQLEGVKNYCFTAREQGEDIVFLRKLIHGEAGQSYGIHVAKLAGLPQSVLAHAAELLDGFNESNTAKPTRVSVSEKNETPRKGTPAANDENNKIIIDALREIEVEKITPLEAIVALGRLRELL
jgi:DNA mismatch repair protein MutS